MNNRTGKECKKTNCGCYVTYFNWQKNLENGSLEDCINCRHAHVSQYKNVFKLQEKIDRQNKRIAK